MKYKPSALVETMSGSQGDSTFSTGRAGDYIRRRVDPAQPRTANQVARRNSFSTASSAWRLLTAGQRAGWRNLAATVTLTNRYGATYKPTGQQLFVGTFATADNAGVIISNDAPGSIVQPAAVEITELLTKRGAAAANDVLTLKHSGFAAGPVFNIYATGNYSAGREYVAPGSLKFILTSDTNAGNTVVDFKAAWEAIFGRPAIGSKITVSVQVVSQAGFASPKTSRTNVVIAV
jgi:hypothetical protein